MRRMLSFFLLLGVAAVGPQVTEGQTRPSSLTRGAVVVRVKPGSGGPKEAVPLYKASHALVIGASNYQNWPGLPGAKEDVEAVQRILEAHGFQVEVVLNPTGDQLFRAFTGFISRHGMDAENRVLVYFAGHGYSIAQNFGSEMGYIVPVDAPLPGPDPTAFRLRSLSMNQIVSFAYEMQARHALFVFDACFSGALFGAMRSPPGEISIKTILPARQFITSGMAREPVLDRSRFREAFVEALRGGADLDNNRYVTALELAVYLPGRVTAATNGLQHPQYGTLPDPNLNQGDFVFELGQEDTDDRNMATLVLNSQPESRIYVNYRLLESFPVMSYKVPAGKHLMEFKLEGSEIRQSVEVKAGQTLRCLAQFQSGRARCDLDGPNEE